MILTEVENYKIKRSIWVLSFVIDALLLLCLLRANLASWDIWADEACTIEINRLSWKLITHITAIDVHLPFYHYLVKMLSLPLRLFPLGLRAEVGFLRFTSLLPLLFVVVISFCLGWKKQYFLWMPLFLLQFEAISSYSNEIRMYTWTILLVLLSTYFLFKAIDKPNNQKNWGGCILLTCTACYSHYYAIYSMFLIFFIAGILFIHEKIVRRKLLLSGMVLFLLFLPWLLYAGFEQLTTTKEFYWSDRISKNLVVSCFYFITNSSMKRRYILLLSVTLIILSGVRASLKNKVFDRKVMLAVACVFLPCVEIATSIIIGWLYRPVLVNRYLLPSLGAVVIGETYLLSVVQKNNSASRIVAQLFIVGSALYLSLNAVRGNLNMEKSTGAEWNQFIAEFGEKTEEQQIDMDTEDIYYIGDGKRFTRPMAVLYPEANHYYKKNDGPEYKNRSEYEQLLFNVEYLELEEVDDKKGIIVAGKDDYMRIMPGVKLAEFSDYIFYYKDK